jgi:uncharacterized protein YfiM (DUF2279 family)
MNEHRRIYESYLEAELTRWKADLSKLKAKGQGAGSEAMALHESIEALQRKHDEASFHLSSLKGASDEAWDSVRAHTERGWMQFKSLFQRSVGTPSPSSSGSEE